MLPRKYFCKASFPSQKHVGSNRKLYIVRRPEYLLNQVYLDWDVMDGLGRQARTPGYHTAEELVEHQIAWCETHHGGHDEPPIDPLITFTPELHRAFMAWVNGNGRYVGPPIEELAESVGALSTDPRTQPQPTAFDPPPGFDQPLYTAPATSTYTTPASSFASSQAGPSSAAYAAPHYPSATASRDRIARRTRNIQIALEQHLGLSNDDDDDVASDDGTVATLDNDSGCYVVTARGVAPTVHGSLKGAHRQKKALCREGRANVLVHYACDDEARDRIFSKAAAR
ncbi:hypothetical protein K523DRAFT_357807 [Schizophyllum commune Tattone D]|nr:hypothetical protein K523DRAFT_357807 [Schizophyllum commune Tattone D]